MRSRPERRRRGSPALIFPLRILRSIRISQTSAIPQGTPRSAYGYRSVGGLSLGRRRPNLSKPRRGETFPASCPVISVRSRLALLRIYVPNQTRLSILPVGAGIWKPPGVAKASNSGAASRRSNQRRFLIQQTGRWPVAGEGRKRPRPLLTTIGWSESRRSCPAGTGLDSPNETRVTFGRTRRTPMQCMNYDSAGGSAS